MAQTLTDLFGTNATDSGSTLTINLADFVDADNNHLLRCNLTLGPILVLLVPVGNKRPPTRQKNVENNTTSTIRKVVILESIFGQ